MAGLREVVHGQASSLMMQGISRVPPPSMESTGAGTVFELTPFNGGWAHFLPCTALPGSAVTWLAPGRLWSWMRSELFTARRAGMAPTDWARSSNSVWDPADGLTRHCMISPAVTTEPIP
jgi:hypothetical protein